MPFIWAFPFLKKKGAGLEFILSPVEGLQSSLPGMEVKPARMNEFIRSGGDFRCNP